MEFVESLSRSNSSDRMARLTVTLISERTNWVSVSNPLANQLFGLDVLPVVLQLRVLDGAGFPSKQPNHTHYVTWTGGVMSGPGTSSGPRGSLGVPSALAAALGLRAGAQVQVAPLLDVPAATVVQVEPVGESDWEVVEANAGFLEEQMLTQVGVLARGQHFTVWARGGAAVRLRAGTTQPADLVRLVPGCEVHVAPKPRGLPVGGQDLGQGHGSGRGQQAPSTATVVPLGGTASWPGSNGRGSGTGGAGGGLPGAAVWQEPWQQQQRQQLDGRLRAPSYKSTAGNVNDNGNSNGARSPAPAPVGGAAPWCGEGGSNGGAGGAMAGAAAAAVAGVGLQARPAWAGALRPMPGRVTAELVSGPGAAAVAAGLAAASNGSSSRSVDGGRGLAGGGDGAGGASSSSTAPQPTGAEGAPGEAGSAKTSSAPDARSHGPSSPTLASATADGHGRHGQQQQQQHLSTSDTNRNVAAAASAAAPSATALPPPWQSAQAVASEPPPQRPQPRLPSQTSWPLHHPHHHHHHLHHAPQPLRLRVLDPPASKYLVPLPSQQQQQPGSGLASGAWPEGAPASMLLPTAPSSGSDNKGASALASDAAISTWLTLAVAVAPVTAAVLLGVPASGEAAAAGGRGGGGGAVVRLHGRGTVRDLLGVLVPEPACPPGHVMLAPPLQHVLCVLPHMYVTVTALPTVAEAVALPSLTLHPLSVPAVRHWGSAGSRAGGGAAAATAPSTPASQPAAALAHAPASEEVLHYHAALASAGMAASALPAVLSQALSHAVHRWLAAQMDGIRRAVLECSCSDLEAAGSGGGGGGAAASGGEGCSGASPEVLLPLASGAVVHFRIHAAATSAAGRGATATNGSSSAAHTNNTNTLAGGNGVAGVTSPAPGDYSLIVHAVRRTSTTGMTAQHPAGAAAAPAAPLPPPPPLVSARTLAALLTSTSAPSAPPSTPTEAMPGGPQRAEAPHAPAALASKIGQPIVLPDVSYASARHAAVLAARPLPPPPLLQPQPAHSSMEAWSSSVTAADVGSAICASATEAEVVNSEVPGSRSTSTGAAALDLDLDHISWLNDQLEGCLRRLLPQLDPWVGAAVARAGLPRCGGVLVTGPQGSGRSQLLSALGDLAERHPAYQSHVVHVRCGQLAGSSHGATTAALAAVAAEALHCSPCLLLLDDLDKICPSVAEGSEYVMQHPDGAAAAARLADWLSSLLDELSAATAAAVHPEVSPSAAPPPAVAVVASARDAAAVHAALRRVGRLDFEVRLPTPGSRGRTAMLAAAARQRGVAVDAAQLAAVAGAAEGFEGVDLRLLLDRAVHLALHRQLSQQPEEAAAAPPGDSAGRARAATTPAAAASTAAVAAAAATAGSAPGVSLTVTEGDLRSALEGFVPAAFWGVQQASAAGGRAEGWEDVGGLPDVVASLREALLLPVRHRDLVAAAPLRLRTGALLYGPPGCGKTHVVGAAVAAVSKVAPVRFLTVKGPELLNKYIGASEAAVRDLFARAAAAAPAVLFFDEFDAIAPPRGHDSTGVTDRVVNQLLTELDGVEGLRGVVVLAATSRPDLIDAALLRPGRLDRLLFCGPPQGSEQRLQVLHALSRRLNLATDVDLKGVAEASQGMTGADLGAVLSEAQLHAINESVEATLVTEPSATLPTGPPSHALPAGGAGGRSGGYSGSGGVSSWMADAPTGEDMALRPGTEVPADTAPRPSPMAASAGPVICMRHVLRAMEAARPSLPAAEAARLNALYARFRQDREAPGTRPGHLDLDPKAKRATLA